MDIAAPTPVKQGSNRSILLVDVHKDSRDIRAENMRKLGATVDCVSNSDSALSQFGPGLYRLVLIDLGNNVDGAEQLARDIRLKHPKQMVGFLIGAPTFIARNLTRKAVKPISIPVGPTEPVVSQPDESDFGRSVREAEQRGQK